MKRSSVFVLLLGFVPWAHAATLNWGSAFGDFVYQSDGLTKAPNSFHFELGTFADGFLPSTSNAADWETNWHLLDQADYNANTGRFAGSVTLLNQPAPGGSILDGNAADTASFFFGKPGYIWIYNQNTTIDSTLEWTLLSNPTGGGDDTSAWTFPTAVQADPRNIAQFALSDPGVAAGFGAENGGGSMTMGEGDSAGPPLDPYTVQTFTIATPIPEPSALAMGAFGMLLLIGRRRRGNH